MARSEAGYIPGKVNYADLNLTQYPDKIDSRVTTEPGYNANMKGFQNITDYNMAEHINAVGDAVISVQRALGVLPFRDKDGVSRGTVDARIKLLENKDYDIRYGGTGWANSQTLIGHTHTGAAGHPSQINLVTETQGKLPKSKVNLTYGNVDAITGADLSVSNSDSRKITDAINDKLSVTQGGTIQRFFEVRGNFASRFYREWDSATITAGGTPITDYSTMTNQARRTTGTAETWLLNTGIQNLLYGRYVIGFRLRTNRLSTQELFRTGYYYMNSSGSYVWQSGISVKGTDFNAVNQWQTFYHTVEHKGERSDAQCILHAVRSATSTDNTLDIDNIIMMPTHPAILDR